MSSRIRLGILLLVVLTLAAPRLVHAQTAPPHVFLFSTGDPDGRIGMASRPGAGADLETEAADDFILTSSTDITAASFTGLLPLNASLSSIQQVRIEIYRVFPVDSNAVRTPNVPTRVNSPSDVEFQDRDSANGSLSFSASLLSRTPYTVGNSVDAGIHPSPNQTTGGDGPRTGNEVRFDVTFTPPFTLPADHYFFVPQVLLSTGGHFLWLSAPGPALFTGDLQAWIRNANLDPDWLRVGTDIVGGAARFNGSFTLFSDKTGTMSFFPFSGTFSVGQTFQTTLYLSGNGQTFDRATATVAVSSNLRVLALTRGTCPGLSSSPPYNVQPTAANPSFGLLFGPEQNCTLYTLTLQGTAPGVGRVSITNPTMQNQSSGGDLIKSTTDAAFTLQ